MGDEERLQEWREAYAAPPPEGWEFSEFDGRIEESSPPWDFADLAREALAGSTAALDLGTGGGELLLTLRDALPDDTHATEGWPPNLAVARRALGPHGIEVGEHDSEHGRALPYPPDRFEVVLNRHESYVAADVMRVLRPGGIFLTQQVDGRNLDDLAELFGAGPAYPGITLPLLRAEAEQAGFTIELARAWAGPIRFPDVVTLLSYCRLMPWQLPGDFSVDAYADPLLALEHAGGALTFTERRFVLRCRSPWAA